MAYPQEKFTSIKSEVIEVVSDLLQSFNPDGDEAEVLENQNQTLAHYVNRVARIGMAASVIGHNGLHDICVLFQSALRELRSQSRILTDKERELLEEWPLLVMGYMSAPLDESSSEALLDHLCRITWVKPPAEHEISEIRETLARHQQSLASEATQVVIEESADLVDTVDNITPETPEPSTDTESEAKADIVEGSILHDAYDVVTNATLQDIKLEVKEAIDELIVEIEAARQVHDSDAIRLALQLCADRMEIMGMSIAASGMMGLMDVSLMFMGGLRDLAKSEVIDEEQLEPVVFHTWVDLIGAYLDTPNDDVQSEILIEFLRQIPWVAEITDEEADALHNMLVPELIELSSGFADEDDQPLVEDAAVETTAEQSGADLASEDVLNELLTEEASSETLSDEEPTDKLLEESAQPIPDAQSEQVSIAEELETDLDITEATATDSEQAQYSEEVESAVAASHEVESDPDSDSDSDLETIAESQSETVIDETTLELINLVSMEIESSQDELQALIDAAVSPEQEAESATKLTEYNELVERFTLACESVGFNAMHNVLKQIQGNIQFYIENGGLSTNTSKLLSRWPQLVLVYLADLGNAESVQQIIEYLYDTDWPRPLKADVATTLRSDLLTPQIEFEEEPIEPRQRVASDEDVSLSLPDDVNSELLESLLHELPQHTSEFTEAITRLTEGAGTQADVDIAQRVAHTLKGSANTVGVPGVANLTHHIEDILLAFSKHEVLPGQGLSESLMKAADTLEVMSEALLGMGAAPADAREVLQEILDWANLIDSEGIPEEDVTTASVEQSAKLESGEEQNNQPAQTAEQEEKAQDAVLRVPASLVDELLRLVGETVIINGQLQEHLKQALQQTRTTQEQNALFQQLTFELEQLVDIQGLTSPQHRIQQSEEFDALEMDQYNELHTVTRRLVEAATDSQEMAHNIEESLTDLDGLVVEQGRLHRQSQEVVMQTRMVPVQNIVPRLHRSVRQTSRLTDKKVVLDVEGSDTLMDSDVLNDLIDPLMHIIRNAIDHGIEKAERRSKLNKERSGHITLSFARQGDQMIVRCQDDGAGLNYPAIQAKAVELGLIGKEDDVSYEELRRFILKQGFSTRNETTQVSGRGIGMDAVYNRVLGMKGSLAIESEPGAGTLVELRLPVTFISIHALLVRMRKQIYALSSRGVEQILYAGAGTLSEDDDMLTYQLGEEVYDAVYLDSLLHLDSDRRHEQRHTLPVLLVREDTGVVRAIIVEDVLASQDLVVKQLGQFVPSVVGIEGATILGDGSVAPVLDLPQLLHNTVTLDQDDTTTETVDTGIEMHLPCALVVDDSLTARRTLAEFVQDVGYEVRTARDGLEAIEVMEGKRPDILLVDLEMPRMNGLELTSHVRAEPELKEIPIIMITSRSTEKHRQQAEAAGVNVYLTKPFSEEELIHHIETELVTTV